MIWKGCWKCGCAMTQRRPRGGGSLRWYCRTSGCGYRGEVED